MYIYNNLLNLQHAVLLQCLKDISTQQKRKSYWYSAYRGLQIYAPYYHMTAREMVSKAIKSGYVEKFTDDEVKKYGRF